MTARRRRRTRSNRVLVYHRAAGWVHQSIPAAVCAIRRLGLERGFDVDSTDDPDVFEPAALERFDALVFVHTSGDVLPQPSHRASLEDYVRSGGGFFGVHSASSTGAAIDADWPWYRELIGASFVGHTRSLWYADVPHDTLPEPLRALVPAGPFDTAPGDAEIIADRQAVRSWERAVVHVEDPSCPAARGIDDGAVFEDEWYGFDENPRPRVNVAVTVDESTYDPHLGMMGADHPVVWWRDFDGGRSVYNAMGHGVRNWCDERFLRSVTGGIELAAGWADDDGSNASRSIRR